MVPDFLQAYWQAVLNQQDKQMKQFFHPYAQIRWHNTNELFTVAEFIRANCEYPGHWQGVIKDCRPIDEGYLMIVKVIGDNCSFHVTSLIHIIDQKIAAIDEYWGEDGEAPQWRKELRIGTQIQ